MKKIFGATQGNTSPAARVYTEWHIVELGLPHRRIRGRWGGGEGWYYWVLDHAYGRCDFNLVRLS